MLVQYQLKTTNAPKDVNLSSNDHSFQLNRVNKNKFTSQFIIQNNEIVTYSLDDNTRFERKISFEKDSYVIINDSLDKMQVTLGQKQVTFALNKQINWPYVPCVLGSIQELGNWNPQDAQIMILNGNTWYLTISVSKSFEYKFAITKMFSNEITWERTHNRNYNILTAPQSVELKAEWERKTNEKSLGKVPRFVHFSINYKTNSCNDYLVVVGNTEQLGKWNPKRGRLMKRYLDYNWKLGMIIQDDQLEYKFVVVSGDNFIWEDGCNRELEVEERTYCDISQDLSILCSCILELSIKQQNKLERIQYGMPCLQLTNE
ncbi:unnamed protein product (macronuclear) [Paramecium tetraurelia]|uniref:CBM20 domain-containing protein n=1 Tax=Paramecium tetraurelia TaxID=5888 RepID=A0C3C9_PARTE|nr:uncharacterized protein GSPATT00034775001 [Paramecium tetraurelia]CAK65296.1 unnamed protein product [Paramecium tetraurelia]|eukprot:XP_001432693.1 hypothetical protein (macronuclear) [Paramecium tetraurelia strain d4-2]